jgi:uncharacterized protein YutE (UPF0331/DUF86 family)
VDHLEEAKQELENGVEFWTSEAGSVDEARYRLQLAQVHALIAIAESLAALAGTVDPEYGNTIRVEDVAR